ncbi:MAG: hypothetical protein IT486_06185 [Gammaproteobacteria bacterium]|nr:hypothetical protein [Gammaproteobacteria bacterium]
MHRPSPATIPALSPAVTPWIAAAPLAVVAGSLLTGIVLALASLAALAAANLAATALTTRLAAGSRVLAAQLVAAATLVAAGLTGAAFAYDALLTAGLWLPLVLTQATLLPAWDRSGPVAGARAPAAWRTGSGVALVPVVIGATREYGGELLEWAGDCHLATAPAAAFLLLAALVAATTVPARREAGAERAP